MTYPTYPTCIRNTPAYFQPVPPQPATAYGMLLQPTCMRLAAGSFRLHSGGWNCVVPALTKPAVAPSAQPKSATATRPSCRRSTLAGLMSDGPAINTLFS